MMPQIQDLHPLMFCGLLMTMMMHRFCTSYACGQALSLKCSDAQLIELLGLDGYLSTDLPDWMMTDLGMLAAKDEITADEFVTTLTYVLENP